MKTKKALLCALLMCYGFYSQAQTITSARFRISDHSKGIRSIELVLDNTILVGINEEGRIDYTESVSGNVSDYHASPDLERNYGQEKTIIGNLPVRYYDNFDIHDPKGKLKSIGNIQFKYNNTFDIHEEFGSLKSVGDIQLSYYNTFDIHDPQGKVKSIGNVQIKYFNKFDGTDRFGSIKSIEGNTTAVSVLAARK
ncbi:hypothetical protein [Pedobacter sp.]|uniref:hypothetical protein n=1 Tax=Pedobacter sp. TaxID=1411316 RepID=UPI002BD0B058|nr:hypothetical protein [Pedobacter sp.]HWW38677.1 hypothetical protein [Pedobacter sp.]